MSKKDTKAFRKSGLRVSPREANAMFEYWASGPDGATRSDSAVAKKFKRARNTVAEKKKTGKWQTRLDEIVNNTSIPETDERVGDKIIKTRDALKDIFDQNTRAILAYSKKFNLFTVEDFAKILGPTITLGRLVSELEGIVPTEGGNTTTIYQLIKDGKAENITDEEVGESCEEHGAILKRL